MAQTSSAEIKVSALTQIGIVVKDLDKTMKDYWNMLGIGPWTILTLQPPGTYDLTYRGKPASFQIRVALVQVGPLELELMETLEGHTAYDDFMAEYGGEGANHVQYRVDSVTEIDRHVEIMAKKGIPSAMGGHFGDNGGFNYLDTARDLKTIWEPVRMADNFSGPITTYPASKADVSPAKVKVKAITQVGIVVKDIEEVMENYWNLLGIGPWDVCEVAPPTLHDHTYHGKPGNFAMRVSFAKVGPVELELLQPVSGDNIYSDFITRHGEAIHHLQFIVDDVDTTTGIMKKEGFPTLMAGRFSDGGFAYYDTAEPLKIIWEAFQPPKKMPAMTCYP